LRYDSVREGPSTVKLVELQERKRGLGAGAWIFGRGLNPVGVGALKPTE